LPLPAGAVAVAVANQEPKAANYALGPYFPWLKCNRHFADIKQT
jgi:hypothetical protein